jgi:hypothetical protein
VDRTCTEPCPEVVCYHQVIRFSPGRATAKTAQMSQTQHPVAFACRRKVFAEMCCTNTAVKRACHGSTIGCLIAESWTPMLTTAASIESSHCFLQRANESMSDKREESDDICDWYRVKNLAPANPIESVNFTQDHHHFSKLQL